MNHSSFACDKRFITSLTPFLDGPAAFALTLLEVLPSINHGCAIVIKRLFANLNCTTRYYISELFSAQAFWNFCSSIGLPADSH